ncbi:hypothetical protein [Leptospira kirschneri]|uniref:hypothetical protein n=1 Tax=Leptospira kirschneri TaxID=29507 RepID=UPI0012F6CFF3|nr:hypothetical protein [Leptospira kirschneri]UZW34965.1 hypothetical protein ORQ95_09590 [Leptospira kirschneri]WBF93341.1 hypothetical protein LIX31_09755 [Leptospira kirschneri]WHO98673.1 hypothetical protein QMK36_09600 [Leptospira kirschneri]
MKPELLLDLHASLVKNCFDRIEAKKETIYDRGGESVQVRSIGKHITNRTPG